MLSEGLGTQVIVFTATVGGDAGFTLSWFLSGASLVAPPLLISILLLRSVAQQIINQKNYKKFKELVHQMLNDDEVRQTLKAYFMESEVPKSHLIEMKPFEPDKNPLPEFDFDLQSAQTPEEFIKKRMEKELGLVENPTQEQLKEIIHRRKVNRKPKGKTVYFKDFINEINEGLDDFIDAEIVKEPIRVQVKNEEF